MSEWLDATFAAQSECHRLLAVLESRGVINPGDATETDFSGWHW